MLQDTILSTRKYANIFADSLQRFTANEHNRKRDEGLDNFDEFFQAVDLLAKDTNKVTETTE